ncbi:molybdopterin-dependent oxidoreductase [Rhodobacterales bacterium HKCCE2091]|nr:molybdopterin-dependent oxidoreductase [Rhodobacterales bacterium HKCCE2091]
MAKFGTSQAVTRKEDVRFLTGHGRYIDDVAPEGALFAYVFRSTIAHGSFDALDLDDAKAAPGVAAIYTAADLAERGLANEIRYTAVKNRDGSPSAQPLRPILAEGRVRFVGEALAFIVAETLAQAKDAAELIGFDPEELPVHLGLEPGGEALHPEAPDNQAFDWALGDEEATDAALAGSAHRVTLEIGDNRVIANSMEPRGGFAEPIEGGRIHVSYSGQGVWGLKDDLAHWLGEDASTFHITTPDVGGGFGMKGAPYPEEMLLALAARDLGRPVRWIEERTEAMLSDNAGRDLVSIAEIGFDEDLKITGYKVEVLSNLGAYNSQFGQMIQSQLFSRVLTGPYDIGAAFLNTKGFFTNTTQVDAYRGAGRPEAIYTLERLMDHAARVLEVDPLELRRRNFIRSDQMPYRTVAKELYDVGDFARVLARGAVEADIHGFVKRREASEAAGRLRGLGVCYYIESILGDPSETARIEVTETGAKVYVGTQSNGQGHETVFAQMVHERTGVPFDAIEVVQGDSDLIAKGGGTGGSRSVTTQGTAIRATSTKLIEGLSPFVAGMLETEEVSFDADEGVFRSPGSNTVVTILEAAGAARAAGQAGLAVAEETTKIPGRSFPNGCHVCEVEIDRETGQVSVDRYVVTDDFGNLMNPMLAEGQVHGGVVQGIGQALSEHTVYDENGQLLTATFMDYGMPRAIDMPFIAFHSEPVPSTANPLGMKGCGEAGTVGSMAAVANAVQDALWPLGIRQVDMPFTPARVWAYLQDGAEAGAGG